MNTENAVLSRCGKGKRRNPKTKRCRKLCLVGHHRNPKTKRCRRTCKSGTRRNRKTHRCMKNNDFQEIRFCFASIYVYMQKKNLNNRRYYVL